MTTAAANLRYLRSERGLTKRALARAAAMEESFYGKVERGERNASIPGYERLARALGVSVSVLFAPPAGSVTRPGKRNAPGRPVRRVRRHPASQPPRE